MNADIITGLIYKHMDVESVVVQKLNEKTTLFVFPGGKEIKKNM